MATEATTPTTTGTDSLVDEAKSQLQYYCDGCGKASLKHEVRHKCNDCPDFDYCSECFAEAELLHPGHSFTKFEPTSPRPADEEEKKSSEDEEVWQPRCRSCASVTRILPILFLALDDPEYEGATSNNLQASWILRISHLIQATQRGCAFCCFVLDAFFRKSNMEMYGYDQDTPWYAEPLNHDKERTELVQHCMKTLTRLKNDRFKFRVMPKSSRKGISLPDFDRISIQLDQGTTKYNTMAEIRQARVFHSAGVIAVERAVCAAAGRCPLRPRPFISNVTHLQEILHPNISAAVLPGLMLPLPRVSNRSDNGSGPATRRTVTRADRRHLQSSVRFLRALSTSRAATRLNFATQTVALKARSGTQR